jgi:hypothetical protein
MPPPPLRFLALGLALAAGVVAAVLAYQAISADDDAEEAPRPQGGSYVNSRLRYNFDYPPQWADVKDRVEPAIAEEIELLDDVYVGELDTLPDVFHGVRVTVTQVDHQVPREGIEGELAQLDGALRSRAAAAGAEFWEPEWVELGGLKARRYITEYPLGRGFELATAQVVTYFGDRQYIVSCQGRVDKFDEAVLAGCEKVLQSFRFR